MKPYSESCDQNREPILSVLQLYLPDRDSLLEIGSGTGQHAVFFAPRFPDLQWTPSDQAENLPGIKAWIDEFPATNIQSPVSLNVKQDDWPQETFQAIFSANTVHIMSWPEVVLMFAGIGRVLENNGVFILYGPFNYNGNYTSESNRRFDVWLKERDVNSGIRDFEALCELALENQMNLLMDHEMPANNRTLVWQKTGG